MLPTLREHPPCTSPFRSLPSPAPITGAPWPKKTSQSHPALAQTHQVLPTSPGTRAHGAPVLPPMSSSSAAFYLISPPYRGQRRHAALLLHVPSLDLRAQKRCTVSDGHSAHSLSCSRSRTC
ncbi:hypothetical protein K523DRAFT_324370 [Schizophyllum commune Tattone D]|nr:hypothetical protein K523DRAFT_324370 [Schizophyllum commune Tattone D]